MDTEKLLTEEEKGKVRVTAIMCGATIPAWAMPNNERNDEDEQHGQDHTS